MCGNSPMAWAVVLSFASVTDADYAWLRESVEGRWGDVYSGHAGPAYGLICFLFFLVPYLVYGFTLLPLELCGSSAVLVGL